jgi:hypothetical protein
MDRFAGIEDRVVTAVLGDATKEAKARERAMLALTEAWDSLEEAKMRLQEAMRESGSRELWDVVRKLESMNHDLSGMKRTVAGFGRK